MEISAVGIDLAKNVFQVHGADKHGRPALRRSLSRSKVLVFFAKLPRCLIGMEACSSSHYWARELSALGHEVKLMPPQYVKPYVKTNKNDVADAEAICEALVRPTMRFVEIKTPDQQAMMLIHREREGAVKDRTALINRLRATLAEFGFAIPVGPSRMQHWFRNEYGCVEHKCSDLLKRHVMKMRQRLESIEQHIASLDTEIDQSSRRNDACARLETVPGIGRLTASALVASIGQGQTFKSGRQFAAWLGLVPKQNSSGGKQRLQGISKRGDGYLRRMLIHGARAVIRHMNPKRDITAWLLKLSARAHRNVVIVALANKLARIAWALLSKGGRYQSTVN
ncbi:MAG: IS110 family transposase [Pseudomonadales bacterium]|nr:IS110 family transposase [Pseudomonadales bacterium]MCP5358869.1 IS110 family transposase [Pseudomonadales bacterium]